jgi:hypothetical protein
VLNGRVSRKGKCFEANAVDAWWRVHVLHDHQRQLEEDPRQRHAPPESVLCMCFHHLYGGSVLCQF